MEMLAPVLLILGGVIVFVGAIWFLIESFRESILWGLGCLIFAPVQLVFLILHWGVAKKPFGLQLLGFAIMFLGAWFTDSRSVPTY
ncbi:MULTISPECIES: hypothetical protein [unclassified Lentimonas]|uniref:hypothetical protein n=1 Tax=unclassified Lentimonas TaxID=2630993 RepID=UPI001328F356|nr:MULTISPECIES: hypothetical protein [unclassified Lentimonas]CAA7182357.1 Unannotated [Lentimonas sp. CC8]CAA6676736.1 Unannotated [Lentimonas sp. CC4]CAA6684599.1 Unannotated [Lentimonas sp. CC6]CAA6694238.1 Unannotated [Lentimonas sp. CC10]CAA6694269.1 Unannotated [Lentimonas sp. CC19]